MQCQEFIALLQKYAPLSAAAEWDNSGMQVVGVKDKIERVAVALDPSVATVDAAVAFNADFILCHHPLSFKPQSLSVHTNYSKIVRTLMQNGTHLYSAHTSLDANPAGPSCWLADEFKLTGLKMLEPVADSEYGFGFAGDLPGAIRFDDFLFMLKSFLPPSSWSICGEKPSSIKTVACCPGSGGSFWTNAKELGADIYITGDVKYHVALDAEICILDVGHFSLEEEMMRRFAQILASEAKGLEFKYFAAKDPITCCYI